MIWVCELLYVNVKFFLVFNGFKVIVLNIGLIVGWIVLMKIIFFILYFLIFFFCGLIVVVIFIVVYLLIVDVWLVDFIDKILFLNLKIFWWVLIGCLLNV